MSSTPTPQLAQGAASLVILFATYLITIAVWQTVTTRLGASIRYRDAIQLWSFSNLGRYLPGKIWQVVGVVVLGKDFGITPARAVTIAFLNLALMIGTGAALGIYFLPHSLAQAGELRTLTVVLAVASLLPVVWPRVLHVGLRRFAERHKETPVDLPPRSFLAAIAAAFLGIWILQGLSFFVLATAWVELSWLDLPRLAGAYAISYVAGLLAFFAPGGIGVREGFLTIILEPLGQRGVPVNALVVGSRLWSILAEIMVLVLAVALRFQTTRSVMAGREPK
jgi:hypothetical protein